MEYLGLRLRKLVFCSLRPRMWKPALAGIAPSIEHLQVFRGIRFETVLDVGANRGQFAMAARYLWPQAQILCFEPLPDALGALSKNATRIGAKVHKFGLGALQSEVPMYVTARDDSSSFLPVGRNQERSFGTTVSRVEAKVAVRRLDNSFDPSEYAAPILMKIDVQGSELQVLDGAGALLSEIAAVYVECSFQELYVGQALATDIVILMTKRGFKLAGVYNQSFGPDARAQQADFLFINESFSEELADRAD